MTRLMIALINGENLLAATTFNKGKGSTPPPPPMVAPAPPVEEMGAELGTEDIDKKKRTGKSSLKMPLKVSNNTGLKL